MRVQVKLKVTTQHERNHSSGSVDCCVSWSCDITWRVHSSNKLVHGKVDSILVHHVFVLTSYTYIHTYIHTHIYIHIHITHTYIYIHIHTCERYAMHNQARSHSLTTESDTSYGMEFSPLTSLQLDSCQS